MRNSFEFSSSENFRTEHEQELESYRIEHKEVEGRFFEWDEGGMLSLNTEFNGRGEEEFSLFTVDKRYSAARAIAEVMKTHGYDFKEGSRNFVFSKKEEGGSFLRISKILKLAQEEIKKEKEEPLKEDNSNERLAA